jgi:hypothetical protein
LGKEDTDVLVQPRTSERVVAPSSDEQAIHIVAGTQASAEFIKEYCGLRRTGTPLEQALVLLSLSKPSGEMVEAD